MKANQEGGGLKLSSGWFLFIMQPRCVVSSATGSCLSSGSRGEPRRMERSCIVLRASGISLTLKEVPTLVVELLLNNSKLLGAAFFRRAKCLLLNFKNYKIVFFS